VHGRRICNGYREITSHGKTVKYYWGTKRLSNEEETLIKGDHLQPEVSVFPSGREEKRRNSGEEGTRQSETGPPIQRKKT